MTVKLKHPYQVAIGDTVTSKHGTMEKVKGVRMLERMANLYEIQFITGVKMLIGGRHWIGVISQEAK